MCYVMLGWAICWCSLGLFYTVNSMYLYSDYYTLSMGNNSYCCKDATSNYDFKNQLTISQPNYPTIQNFMHMHPNICKIVTEKRQQIDSFINQNSNVNNPRDSNRNSVRSFPIQLKQFTQYKIQNATYLCKPLPLPLPTPSSSSSNSSLLNPSILNHPGPSFLSPTSPFSPSPSSNRTSSNPSMLKPPSSTTAASTSSNTSQVAQEKQILAKILPNYCYAVVMYLKEKEKENGKERARDKAKDKQKEKERRDKKYTDKKDSETKDYQEQNSFYYQGTMKNGMKNGKGILICQRGSGSYYIGQWENDLANGNGKYQSLPQTDELGYTYQGQWRQGQKHGKAVELSSGMLYTGNFQYNMKHGQGLLKYPNSSTYSGQFFQNQISGTGTFSSPTQMYTGDWKNGKMHGTGRCQWKKAEQVIATYIGEYKDGVKEGFGQYVDGKGTRYRAMWINGAIDQRGPVVVEREGKEESGNTNGDENGAWWRDSLRQSLRESLEEKMGEKMGERRRERIR